MLRKDPNDALINKRKMERKGKNVKINKTKHNLIDV